MNNTLFVILTINQFFWNCYNVVNGMNFLISKCLNFQNKLESNNVYNNMCDFVVTYNFVCN